MKSHSLLDAKSRGNCERGQDICMVFKVSPHRLLISAREKNSNATAEKLGNPLTEGLKSTSAIRGRWISCVSGCDALRRTQCHICHFGQGSIT